MTLTYSNNHSQESKQISRKYVLSLLANHLSSDHIRRVLKIISNHKLEVEYSKQDNQARSCVEILLQGESKKLSALQSDLLILGADIKIDIVLQLDDEYRCKRRLVCFDMDSTLIKVEVIDELAKHAGVGSQVAQITESAMQGKLDFNQSFTQRMSLLEGLNDSVLIEIADKLPIMEGAECLFRNLKSFGYKTAILSGGFNYFAKVLQNKFDIDYAYSNHLEINDGLLTGRVVPPIINGQQKELLLAEIAKKEQVHIKQTVAVGDGANDLPMITAAGLGIAYHAKQIVRETANHSISHNNLDSILYILGHTDDEIIR